MHLCVCMCTQKCSCAGFGVCTQVQHHCIVVVCVYTCAQVQHHSRKVYVYMHKYPGEGVGGVCTRTGASVQGAVCTLVQHHCKVLVCAASMRVHHCKGAECVCARACGSKVLGCVCTLTASLHALCVPTQVQRHCAVVLAVSCVCAVSVQGGGGVSLCLCQCPSVSLSVCVCVFIVCACVYVCLCVSVSVCMYVFMCVFAHLGTSLQGVCVCTAPVSLPGCHKGVCVSVCMSVCLCMCLCVRLFVCLCVCLSASVCVSKCVSVHVSI